MRAVALVFTTALAVVASSCKDDPSSATPDGGAAAGGGDPTAFLAALCDAYAPCCASAPAGSDCHAAAGALAKGATFDAARAAACLAYLKANATAASFCTAPPAIPSCSAVFKIASPKPAGAACTKSSECASGDDGDGICDAAKCRHVSAGKEGDTCLGTYAAGKLARGGKADGAAAICDANGGLYCDATTAKCTKRGAVGAACKGADTSCVDDAWCPTDTQQCSTRTPAGLPCTDAYECEATAQCANDGEGGGACTTFAVESAPCPRGDECDQTRGLTCDSDTAKCVKDASVFGAACTGLLALE